MRAVVIVCGFVSVLAATAGCRASLADRFDMSRLRDDRAAELDDRLSKREPFIKNPFAGE
jgi:hypothetical protein